MFQSQHQHVTFAGLWTTHCLILKKGLPLLRWFHTSYLILVLCELPGQLLACEYDTYSWYVHACSAKFFDDLISVENGAYMMLPVI